MEPLPAAIAAARALHLAICLAWAGALLFDRLVAAWQHRPVTDAAAALALPTGLAWAGLQLLAIAGADPPALRDALLDTAFGRFFLLHLLLLAAAWICGLGQAWVARTAAAVLALLALLAPLGAGHAAAAEDGWLLLALAGHLAAAAAWLGGLLPLWLLLGQARAPRDALLARFTRLGLAAVLVLAVTGVVQTAALDGGLPGLAGTAHGQVTLLKGVGFAALLGLALLNNRLLGPALRRPGSSPARLRASILAEMAIGLAVIGLAALLAGLPPGRHLQPDWPLPFRPDRAMSLALPVEGQAGTLLVLMTGLASLLLAGMGRRRPLLWGLIPLLWIGLLLRPGLPLRQAWPSSYHLPPAPPGVAAILRGQQMVGRLCAACQAGLAAPESRLDGELFALAGEADPAATPAERWDMVAFLRAREAGRQWREDGAWREPLAAPALRLRCGGTEQDLAALRGRVVLVGIGFVPAIPGIAQVNLQPGRARPGECAALDPDAAGVFALLAGVAPSRMEGLWFLLDGNGWIRGAGLRVPPDIIEEAASSLSTVPLPLRPHH
jgi:putative copper resistance protein D